LIISQKFPSTIPKGTQIVIVTTSLFNCSKDSSGLKTILKTEFERVFVDEGHVIKCGTSLLNKNITKIKASYKWIVSGTINKSMDLSPLSLSF